MEMNFSYQNTILSYKQQKPYTRKRKTVVLKKIEGGKKKRKKIEQKNLVVELKMKNTRVYTRRKKMKQERFNDYSLLQQTRKEKRRKNEFDIERGKIFCIFYF